MSKLLVVRHGQASFGAANYDLLSPLGEQQSELLGSFLAGRDADFDAVYCGPALRHRQTVEGIRRGAGASASRWPDTVVVEGLAEFPAFQLFTMHGQDALASAAKGGAQADLLAAREHSFKEICNAWLRGSIDSGDLISALDFEAAVTRTLNEICTEAGRGKSLLLVTSGGPTMVSIKSALKLAPQTASDLLWVIANSSVTEFHYRDGERSLVAFNRIAHLQPEHITYR